MKRFLVILALLIACKSRDPYVDLVNTRLARAVSIVSSSAPGMETSCSGVMLSTSRVLTAAHCIHESATVNGHPSYILRKDDKADLALLFIHSRDFEPLKIGNNPHLLDSVFSISDPTDIRIVSIGRIIRLEGDRIVVSVISAHGGSGGALYDADGNLIGILSAVRLDNGSIVFGAAIHGRVIERFLE